jgi:hypothetical protein
MDAWWWIPISLAAWFSVAAAAALLLGRFLSICSQARESLDQHVAEVPDLPQDLPQHWQQAS